MTIERAKGTRDLLPEDEILRNEIIDTLKKTFENYGFSPIETPIIERYETLTSKYAGGSEIVKEMFKLKDQGDRDLGLRYDLTVPLARVIVMNPQQKMPFKRYEIGEVFRDGPIKLGRYRQFTQCDADVVGNKNMMADVECIKLAREVFSRLNMKVTIEVNNRKILDSLLDYLKIPNEKREATMIAIDKIKKVGPSEVKNELKNTGIEEEKIREMMKIFSTKGNNKSKIATVKKIINGEGIAEIEQVFNNIEEDNVEFNIALARGLAYYTGTVFEVYANDKEVSVAIAGGGRYDNMIRSFSEGKREVPAVGISFGLEPITDILKKQKQTKKSVTKAYIIPINTAKKALEIADSIRKEMINVDIDLMERGIGKNMEYANTLGIPYVIFIGEKELKNNKIKLRDMKTGKEKLVSIKDAVKILK
ncbi:MAG: histidine--tRNA ligase [archaeon]